MQSSFTLGKKAWELYLERNILDRRMVRAAVAKSWQRCRELNVDPFRQIDPSPSRGNYQFEERTYRRQQLIQVAKPFMRDLSSSARRGKKKFLRSWTSPAHTACNHALSN